MTYNKIVVFDLDETLGYFVQLGILIDVIEEIFNIDMEQNLFNEILDLYPEFLRPNIIKILKYLKQRNQINNKNLVMIYTNNQGPRNWVYMIKSYFENKINYKLFDQVISAFKVKGEIIEVCRTSHRKSYDDFIRCTKLPKDAKICFLDDLQHDEMIHDNVYYINVKPYITTINFNEMVLRLINSKKPLITNLINKYSDKKDLTNIIVKNMSKYNFKLYNKSDAEQKVDEIIGKTIINHFDTFFNIKLNKTRRRRFNNNKTLKNGH
jgi:hypothetical protein